MCVVLQHRHNQKSDRDRKGVHARICNRKGIFCKGPLLLLLLLLVNRQSNLALILLQFFNIVVVVAVSGLTSRLILLIIPTPPPHRLLNYLSPKFCSVLCSCCLPLLLNYVAMLQNKFSCVGGKPPHTLQINAKKEKSTN